MSIGMQRSCGDCAMCCKLGEIPDFKPFNQWCQHCSTKQRCDIYESRPQLCRDFFCHYLQSDLGEEWRPNFCGMIVAAYANPTRLTISVDPHMPERWRREPYLAQIMHWATQGAVTIMVGSQAWAAYPNRVEYLGEITADHTVQIDEFETAHGFHYTQKRVLKN